MTTAKIRVLKRSEWLVEHPELKGVCVGGCINGKRISAYAHAHSSMKDPHRGWVCFRSSNTVSMREIWLHELAHIVTRSGHTKRWREFLLQIGGTLDEHKVPGCKHGTRSFHPKTRTRKERPKNEMDADALSSQ